MDLDGKHTFEAHSRNTAVKYHLTRRMIKEMLGRITYAVRFKLFKDIFYIKAMLLKYEYSKQVFVMDLEYGQEVHIKEDMSQSDISIMFHYYDPIINIADSMINSTTRHNINMKKELRHHKMKAK